MRSVYCRKCNFVVVAVVLVWLLGFGSAFSSGNTSALSNDTSSEAAQVNHTELSPRNSRQLWSLVKNVIKTGLEQSNSGSNVGSSSSSSAGGGLGSGLGTLANLFGSAIASGINSDGGLGSGSALQQYGNQYYQQQAGYHTPGGNLSPNQFNNPNEYMHYLLMNQNSNQHSSLPHYFQQQQQQQKVPESTADLIEKYKEQMTSETENKETATNTGNLILNKLAFGSVFDDLDKVSNLLSFGNLENVMGRINRFDKLKCIPRLLCQMVAKRNEDQKKEEEKKKAKEREDSLTTKKPGNRKADTVDEDDDDLKSRMQDDDKEEEKKDDKQENTKDDDNKSKEGEEEDKKESGEDENNADDDDDDDDDDEEEENESDEAKEYVVIKEGNEEKKVKKDPELKGRMGRLFKLNGSDQALEQFVKFLELMQLKDWSIYPYVNGAYQGHQVSRLEECAYRFSSCPFSDDQLVYYFNNYNGGFFQSI